MSSPRQRAPSETSPLLPPKPSTDKQTSNPSGNTPEQSSTVQEHADGTEEAGASRRSAPDDRLKQYEGIPEVKSRMKYMFPALGLGVFMAAADQTIIASSSPRIGSDLGALNKTSWIASAYLLTVTSFQPLYGKLSDIFGRKPCLMFTYVVFGIGCAFCGLARNMNELIAARALAGIGGGGMTTIVSVLLSDAIPLRERGKWQGYINIIYSAGASLGAPAGGYLADSPIGWRGSFLLQVPLCLAAFTAVGTALKLPPSGEHQTAWRAKIKRVDFLGAVTLVAAVFCLLFALDHGSNVAWDEKLTLIPLGVSFVLGAAFLYVEMKVAAEPFAPGRIIFARSLLCAHLCNFFSFAGLLATYFYIPLYFQAVFGMSATYAGIFLIPASISGVSGSLFAGFLMQKTGRYYWLNAAAFIGLTVGLCCVLTASLSANTFNLSQTVTIIGVCAGMMIGGFSNGIGVTTSLISLISNAARADQAIATACSYLFRSLGSTTGISLSSTAANLALRGSLEKALNDPSDPSSSPGRAEELIRLVRRSLKYIETLDPRTQTIVRRCFATSTQAAFSVQLALVVGSAVAAWGIREKALSK